MRTNNADKQIGALTIHRRCTVGITIFLASSSEFYGLWAPILVT
jgi:hypothetical protein